MTLGHNGGARMARDYGWVAIARAMRAHPLVGFHLFAKPCDANRGATQPALAFIDLIMECQYEDGTVVNGGKVMTIHRGQLVGAVSWLASRWNWTPMSVRTWLDKLELDGIIQRSVPSSNQNNKHHGKVATVITLCKYDEYQSGSVSEQRTEQQITQPSEQQTQQQQYKDNHTNHSNNINWGKRERSDEEIAEADRIAAAAYELGKQLKSGSVAKSGRTASVTTGELDGSRGIAFRDGKLAIVNGTAAMFAEEFPGLDLAAVCNKAGPEIARQKYPTHEFACSVIRKWAQIQIENKPTKLAAETTEQRKKRLFAQAQDEMRGRK